MKGYLYTCHSDEWIIPKTYGEATAVSAFCLGLNKNGDAHVSHKIGNSLCSHPALLISDFGGICGGGLRLRIRKLRKVESKRWRARAPETVDRLCQHASRETLGKRSECRRAREHWMHTVTRVVYYTGVRYYYRNQRSREQKQDSCRVDLVGS